MSNTVVGSGNKAMNKTDIICFLRATLGGGGDEHIRKMRNIKYADKRVMSCDYKVRRKSNVSTQDGIGRILSGGTFE